jgi:hypothetical protein
LWRHSVVSGHTLTRPDTRNFLFHRTHSFWMWPRHNPPSYAFKRNVYSISETQRYRTRSLGLIPINLPFPWRLPNLTYPGLQIGSDVLAFLGFTSQNFRTTKERPHGVDPTYLDRFCARKCPGNAQEKWKEFQITLTLARYS